MTAFSEGSFLVANNLFNGYDKSSQKGALFEMVLGDGIEPPTRGFSVLDGVFITYYYSLQLLTQHFDFA